MLGFQGFRAKERCYIWGFGIRVSGFRVFVFEEGLQILDVRARVFVMYVWDCTVGMY